MSLIIPANTLASGGYAVDNSCRFNEPSSDKLTRSNGTPTSQQKFTHSVWVKRSTVGNFDIMQGFYSNSSNYCAISFLSTDRLDFINYEGGTSARKITTAKFRDLSAWYHICVAVDTTLGTANDRIKMYVNGVLETVFDTNSAPSQNANLGVDLSTQAVGVGEGGGIGYLQGYLAESVYIDGSQNAVTDFGEFDEDSGIWKPIDVSGLTFGTNGFYLDYGNSAALGDDVSGNGNDFTVNNLTAIDQTTDTPTNNFCTLNPLSKGSSVDFSNGNLSTFGNTAGTNAVYSSTIYPSAGKFYVEIKCGTIGYSNNPRYGIIEETGAGIPDNGDTYSVGYYNPSVAYLNDGKILVNGSNTLTLNSFTTNDIISLAIDCDNGAFYVAKNGTWENSGVPTSGASKTGAVFTFTSGTTFSFGGSSYNSSTSNWNFGNPTFTGTDQADGNSRGSFEYAPPSGFLSLCTANLSEVLG